MKVDRLYAQLSAMCDEYNALQSPSGWQASQLFVKAEEISKGITKNILPIILIDGHATVYMVVGDK